MYAVLCSAQLDGIAAAAIVFRAARLRGSKPKLAGLLTFENAQKVFSEAAKQKKQLFFVLDFLPNNIHALIPILQILTKKNRIAYWNSHHPYDAKTLEILKTFARTIDLSGPLHYGTVPRERLCSAELVQKRFLKNDKIAQTLAEFAHDIEFWERKNPQAQKLSDIIASGFDLRELVEILSRGVFWSKRFDALHKEYCEKRDSALQELIAKMQIKKYVSNTFAFALAPKFLASAQAGEHVLNCHSGVDVAVILYRNGKIAFRKRDECELNLAEIAKLFDGGGYKYAAGANLGITVTNENFEKTIFKIDRILKNFFLR